MGNAPSEYHASALDNLTADDVVLHRCVQAGDTNSLRNIISQKSARLNSADAYGNTALHKAAWQGDLQTCKLLVRHGADVCATNRTGKTPLILAMLRARADCVAYLEDFQVLDPATIKSKFRSKVRTSNCAKVFGPRQSIKGRAWLIPGVQDSIEHHQLPRNDFEPILYSDAAHWELEPPSQPAAKPQIEERALRQLELSALLGMGERKGSAHDIPELQVGFVSPRNKKRNVALALPLTLIASPPQTCERRATAAWHTVANAPLLTALWLREVSYFARHAPKLCRVRLQQVEENGVESAQRMALRREESQMFSFGHQRQTALEDVIFRLQRFALNVMVDTARASSRTAGIPEQGVWDLEDDEPSRPALPSWSKGLH